ncbi:MAG TPA: YciI family protein [Nocardioides sp.]|nr:YciI family protein [Nocardioides sp.]
MKFVVLMAETDHYQRWAELSDDERAAAFAAFEKFDAAVAERGEVLGGEGLADPRESRTLAPGRRDDRPVTDGPYAETAEQLGGFYLVDLPDMETAVETARLLPEAFLIEVRPVVSG